MLLTVLTQQYSLMGKLVRASHILLRVAQMILVCYNESVRTSMIKRKNLSQKMLVIQSKLHAPILKFTMRSWETCLILQKKYLKLTIQLVLECLLKIYPSFLAIVTMRFWNFWPKVKSLELLLQQRWMLHHHDLMLSSLFIIKRQQYRTMERKSSRIQRLTLSIWQVQKDKLQQVLLETDWKKVLTSINPWQCLEWSFKHSLKIQLVEEVNRSLFLLEIQSLQIYCLNR